MYTNELFDFGHSKDGNPSLIDGMIRMKIHEQGTFAKFLNSIDIEKNTEALSLKAGWEYHIDVTPFGVRSTSNRKSLSKEKRGCLLQDEVPEGSMFKKYSKTTVSMNVTSLLQSKVVDAFLGILWTCQAVDQYQNVMFLDELASTTK